MARRYCEPIPGRRMLIAEVMPVMPQKNSDRAFNFTLRVPPRRKSHFGSHYPLALAARMLHALQASSIRMKVSRLLFAAVSAGLTIGLSACAMVSQTQNSFSF